MKLIAETVGIILFILSIGSAIYAFRPIILDEFLAGGVTQYQSQMFIFLAILLAILSGVAMLFNIAQSLADE